MRLELCNDPYCKTICAAKDEDDEKKAATLAPGMGCVMCRVHAFPIPNSKIRTHCWYPRCQTSTRFCFRFCKTHAEWNAMTALTDTPITQSTEDNERFRHRFMVKATCNALLNFVNVPPTQQPQVFFRMIENKIAHFIDILYIFQDYYIAICVITKEDPPRERATYRRLQNMLVHHAIPPHGCFFRFLCPAYVQWNGDPLDTIADFREMARLVTVRPRMSSSPLLIQSFACNENIMKNSA